MLTTSARLLELLSLLQVRRDWTGAELADRLGVSTRSVRKDINRLRQLGYPVDANRGSVGGYRLAAGATMPPLLLDDDEAVAIVVGLNAAAHGGVTGIEDTALRALTKLETVLPGRLKRRVDALRTFALRVPPDFADPVVDPEALSLLASACRDAEAMRFAYRSHTGDTSRRMANPHRLVNWGHHWYLIAWDRDRDDWRTFRVDRIERVQHTGLRFTPRSLPDQNVTAWLAGTVARAGWRYVARIRVEAPAVAVLERINPAVGYVERIDDDTCLFIVGGDSLALVAGWIGTLDLEFTVEDPPELCGLLRTYAARYLRAAG